ncbi:MAG: oxidoreductase [Planctomycetes bacterium]|nr:oxidoreductase [Planctomycetota bacterium]
MPQLPWLELAILLPLVGALYVGRLRDSYLARKWCLVFSGVTLLFTVALWHEFHSVLLDGVEPGRPGVLHMMFGRTIFGIDRFSAPLLPLAALLYSLMSLTTLRTKIRRFSFAWSLFSEAVVLATLGCREPWGIIALLAIGAIPPYLELKARNQSARVYLIYMLSFVVLLIVGWAVVELDGPHRLHSLAVVIPILVAVFIRCGIFPFHSWMTDLFEKATFGTALLYVTPITGAYAAVRLMVPVAPDQVLRSIGLLSLVTAVYAAGMALVQREGRRFFCYLFISHSAFVLMGLEMVSLQLDSGTMHGLTGALCLWLSLGMSLGGFGLTLRALEARRGRLQLIEHQGLYEHTPALAICFMLTGLASVGFPGTLGFVGTELLVDSAVEIYPHVGLAVVIAAALNGIAVVKAYFLLFTGKHHVSSVWLGIGAREKFAVLFVAALLLIGGLLPQGNVESRHAAAEELINQRRVNIRLKPEVEKPEPPHLGHRATAHQPAE